MQIRMQRAGGEGERERENGKRMKKEKEARKKTNDYGALNKHVMKFENDFNIMIISSIH